MTPAFHVLRRALAHPMTRDPEPQRRFALRLPGGGATVDPPHPTSGPAPRRAAVLVLISDPGEPRVTLLRRSDDGGVHAGQIAFPGGSREAHDVSLAHTALRETREELGLDPSDLEVIGELAPVFIPPSNFVVTPFVALHRARPIYEPDPIEVDEVFEVPLAAFLDRRVLARETWTLRGERYEVPFYRLGERKIWGATARMLAMLVEAVTRADPPRGGPPS